MDRWRKYFEEITISNKENIEHKKEYKQMSKIEPTQEGKKSKAEIRKGTKIQDNNLKNQKKITQTNV